MSIYQKRIRAATVALARVAVCGLIVGSGCLRAQWGATDAGEVSAYTGIAFGATGARPTVGGSSGISASRYAIALIETSYIPLGHRTLAYHPGVFASSSGLFDFNFVVNVRVPVKERWEPYGILGPAVLYNLYRADIVQPNGTVVRRSGLSDWKFGWETGAGLRYYVRETWGVRGEYRYTISTRNFSRVQAGIFYQFEGFSSPFHFR
jgi:opacity protein-like surface antigen